MRLLDWQDGPCQSLKTKHEMHKLVVRAKGEQSEAICLREVPICNRRKRLLQQLLGPPTLDLWKE